jgi:hypothetical protein
LSQEIVPKPIGKKPWQAQDYQVRKVNNLTGFNEGDKIDLGDKEFQVRIGSNMT